MLQYSHTAHQRVPASKYAQPIHKLPQLLVVSRLELGLMYLLKEEGWNWLLSLAAVEQLAHRGGAQEVVRLKWYSFFCSNAFSSLLAIQDKLVAKKHRSSYIVHVKEVSVRQGIEGIAVK